MVRQDWTLHAARLYIPSYPHFILLSAIQIPALHSDGQEVLGLDNKLLGLSKEQLRLAGQVCMDRNMFKKF